jgi:dicarboxylate transporter DctA-like protein
VEVTDLSLHLQVGWKPPATLEWVELRDVSATLFGGRVTSAGRRFDVAPPQQEFAVQVNVEHLDLGQLLQVEQHRGLAGTGVLDGVIPVRLTSAGVQVHDGRLAARPPGGVIRYQPAPDTAQAVAAGDAQEHLVLQALSNFHYNVLTMEMQYEADGTLHLTVQAEGQNPDWQPGRPIHLNLTVQENIPTLLKSLQIGQGIQQSIEERLQKR